MMMRMLLLVCALFTPGALALNVGAAPLTRPAVASRTGLIVAKKPYKERLLEIGIAGSKGREPARWIALHAGHCLGSAAASRAAGAGLQSAALCHHTSPHRRLVAASAAVDRGRLGIVGASSQMDGHQREGGRMREPHSPSAHPVDDPRAVCVSDPQARWRRTSATRRRRPRRRPRPRRRRPKPRRRPRRRRPRRRLRRRRRPRSRPGLSCTDWAWFWCTEGPVQRRNDQIVPAGRRVERK